MFWFCKTKPVVMKRAQDETKQVCKK